MQSEFLQKPMNLYLSAEHDCSYLPERQANSLFVDPEASMNTGIYSELIQQGFRRSGSHVYTPYCKKCHDCIPVRLEVQKFCLSRSQKRCRNKNQSIIVTAQDVAKMDPLSQTEQFHLYQSYIKSRHTDGGMDNPSMDSYLDFLTSPWSHTTFFEFRESDHLIAVAVTDIVTDGLSAVYTFFEPAGAFQKRSLGIYSILWQAQEARRRGLKWLYLGYWIHGCQKMSYKDNYQPLEYFYNHQWHPTPPPLSLSE
ncbi:MAG: arginyltransferase [gamma proteobacterium symbiont of Taylorina sp.]|nr:arginyltransferase [gamma proteobacterium symbiont of Taylorina sp.]